MTPAARFDLNPYIHQVTRLEPSAVDRRNRRSRRPSPRLARSGRGRRGFLRGNDVSGRRIRTQVIGFRNGNVLSMPLEEVDGIQLHDPIVARQSDSAVPVGPELIGRVIDGFGNPIDRKPQNPRGCALPAVPNCRESDGPRTYH